MKSSKIYSSIKNKYNIMIIKLKDENNKYNYLDLDDHLFDEDSEDIYKNKSIYILHYPNGNKASVSYGYGIEKINNYDIKHLCNTEGGSSGSPILSAMTNKIIGIHKATRKKIIGKDEIVLFNFGTFLKYPLSEFSNIFSSFSK